MTLFRTLEIIFPCSELSIEAASIRGRHAVSERTEDEAAMRSIRLSLLTPSGLRRKHLRAASSSLTVDFVQSQAVRTA